MSRPTDPAKPGRKPPLPPALERKLRQRERATGRGGQHAPQRPPRGGPATRIVRHQGR